MRMFLLTMVFLFSVLNFYCRMSYCIEDDKTKTLPPAEPIPYHQPQYKPFPAQTPKAPSVPMPDLPGIPIPSVSSPRIDIPPAPAPTNFPSFPNVPRLPEIPKVSVPAVPAVPIRTPAPVANIPAIQPQLSLIKSLLGRVTDIGIENDGASWIDVENEITGRILKININPKSIPVVKKGAKLSFEDIKRGDMVNVVYNQEGGTAKASFLSIMTEEDIKAIEESVKKASDQAPKQENPPSLKQ